MKGTTKRKISDILRKNKNIIESLAGGATSYVLTDPTGISGEGIKLVLDKLITKFVNDLDTRKLSELEVIRIGEAFTYSIDEISKNLKEGKQLRSDGFFDKNINDSSDAQEIFEGIIVVSQREYENKKLQYLGKLLANIGFDNSITKQESVQLIELASRLSYRQYIIIAIIVQSQLMRDHCNSLPFLSNTMFKDSDMNYEKISIFQDIFELYRIGLVNGNGKVILEMGYIVPSELNVQGVGVKLYQLMKLNELSKEAEDFLNVFKFIKHEWCHINN